MLAALADAEVQRQSEIHRRYLQKVAADERMRAQKRGAAKKAAKTRVFFPVGGRRQPRGGSSGPEVPSRLLVSNLPFDERASRQRRTLIEAIDNCTTLAARRRFFEHARRRLPPDRAHVVPSVAEMVHFDGGDYSTHWPETFLPGARL